MPPIVNKALVAFFACLIVAVVGDIGGDQSRAGFPLEPPNGTRSCRSKS